MEQILQHQAAVIKSQEDRASSLNKLEESAFGHILDVTLSKMEKPASGCGAPAPVKARDGCPSKTPCHEQPTKAPCEATLTSK
jgi:hypothetical protein